MSSESVEIGRLWLQLKRIADVMTAGQKDLFIGLPGLTGYFPMSIVDTAAKAVNHAQGGLDLAEVGVCPIGYDGNSYRQLGSGVNYLSSSLDYALTGLETYIETAMRGFTIGGWFNVGSLSPSFSGLISKDGGTANRGYSLAISSAGLVRLQVSLSGGTPVFEETATVIGIGGWHFVVARFTPSVEMSVFVDGNKSTKTTGVPASCNVSSQAFEVGRFFAVDANILTSKVRDAFVARAILSDELIEELRLASQPG